MALGLWRPSLVAPNTAASSGDSKLRARQASKCSGMGGAHRRCDGWSALPYNGMLATARLAPQKRRAPLATEEFDRREREANKMHGKRSLGATRETRGHGAGKSVTTYFYRAVRALVWHYMKAKRIALCGRDQESTLLSFMIGHWNDRDSSSCRAGQTPSSRAAEQEGRSAVCTAHKESGNAIKPHPARKLTHP
ncbi:uncharacterized protein DMAD_00544 [Drosophila madeirensis]|uniref:Uncharacterized protein n=1 Tax=Drosophila madeirensis TaxID=30013 RepID=A0AAU9FYB9_DROMD